MTDRIAEIEARLDRKREPCQDIYFDSWNWDQKKFHLHAEDDVAYLLSEVRRLREENDKLRELTAQELSWSTQAIENFQKYVDAHEARIDAESLALELASLLQLADQSIVWEPVLPRGFQDDVTTILSDERLAKLREKKNA